MGKWQEVSIFGQFVHCYQNGVTILGSGQSFHKINGNVIPNLVRDGQRLHQSNQGSGAILVALANITIGDKVLNGSFDVLPMELKR